MGGPLYRQEPAHLRGGATPMYPNKDCSIKGGKPLRINLGWVVCSEDHR